MSSLTRTALLSDVYVTSLLGELPAGDPTVTALASMQTLPLDQVTLSQPVLAQQFQQDFFASSGEILNNFVESGQVWALLIGVVLGYLIRGLTAY
ncbi:MAG: hypothetical protein AAFR42_00675 [Cyanobacteria bacterium J06628_6]